MITITVKDNKKTEEYIGKGSIVKNLITDSILLVTSMHPNRGTIIYSINSDKIGSTSDMGMINEFELFKGIITINCE